MTRMHWMLIAGALARIVCARVDSLSTSAVTYCAPPENVLVQELALTYFRHNASVVFDVTASSLSADLRVALALNLTVYGAQPLSLNLNLCDLASAVCPLPLYNFSGSGTLPIPASFSSKIPSIGYTVPDLEAFAQLELRRVDTGEVAACVSATLTNGWSMRQAGATWGAVGVVLLAIVGSALWALSQARRTGLKTGLWAEKEQWRVVDIVTFVQTIAVSALLNLNYPSAFRAFALNFPFALLLNGPLPSQSAIDNLRKRTGARLTDDALPPDEYVNRKSSPYNVGLSLGPTSHISQTFDLGNGAGYTLTSLDASGLAAPRGLAKRAFINPATVTSADALAGGVPLYVNGAGVATANAFLGVFFEWLVIGAALLFVCLAYILWRRTSRVQSRTKSRTGMSRTSIMIHGMALRLGLVLVLPVSIFAMHQWTLHDSWLATLLSVLCILTTWAGTLYAFVRLSFHAPTEETGRLASLTPSAPTMALYAVPPFLVALFVAFAGKSGTVQVSALLAIEVLVLIAAIIVRWRARRSERDALLNASSETAPYPTSSPVVPPPTRMSITLRVFRIIGTGLLIAFIQKRGVKPIPRTIIGIVAAAVWSLGVVWAFICVVWGLVKLFRRRRGALPVLESGEQREKEDVEGKKEGVQDDYVGAAPVLSRPQPQAFQTGSAQTTYYDAHTGNTPAHGVQEQSGEYFGPRYHAQ